MKKIIAVVLMAGMLVMLAACGSSIPNNQVFKKDDMNGKKVGVQLGTTGDTFVSLYKAEEGPDTVVERFNKGTDAIQALKQGKVDCVVIDKQPAQAFVDKNDDLTILEEDFVEEEYAICVAKKNSDLTAKINTALAELKGEGTLDAIMSNYVGDDKGKNPYESPQDADGSGGTLVMATNAAFEPFEYYSGDKIVGIDVDMAQAICDKLGMTLKIEDMEFDSIINAVQSGKADIGVAGMTVTEERLENIDFTDPYTKSQQVIVVRKK